MNSYIQLLFENISAGQSDVLIAELNEAGFDGFEEADGLLKAFIAKNKFDEPAVNEIARRLSINFSKTIIEETNWNQVWESSFQPVIIGKFVAIRAHFHEPVTGVQQEIIITPKMSFGTGHHATTCLVIEQMKHIDFTGKSVLDFGTGTGILAILAEKLGASSVLAIDHDEWSITNTMENLLQNNTRRVEVKKAGAAQADRQFDIILANINKNVILENFTVLAKQLVPGGVLLLSGLLTEDEGEMIAGSEKSGLTLSARTERHNWLCLTCHN